MKFSFLFLIHKKMSPLASRPIVREIYSTEIMQLTDKKPTVIKEDCIMDPVETDRRRLKVCQTNYCDPNFVKFR